MKIKLVDIFELLTFITTTLNLLLESKASEIINLIVIIMFLITILYDTNKENKEEK